MARWEMDMVAMAKSSGRETRFKEFPVQSYRDWAEKLRQNAARFEALAEEAASLGLSMLQVDGAVGQMATVFNNLKSVRTKTRKEIAGESETIDD